MANEHRPMTTPQGEIAGLVERLRAHLCDNEVYHRCTEAASALERISAERDAAEDARARWMQYHKEQEARIAELETENAALYESCNSLRSVQGTLDRHIERQDARIERLEGALRKCRKQSFGDEGVIPEIVDAALKEQG
jgi:chromosome segregation ATPase